MLKGKDYSQFQGAVDWVAEKAAGVQFAIIRATQGVSFVDSCFLTNQAALRELGIPHGFYHFADSSGPPEVQAAHFLATVGPLQPGESLYLDQEVTGLPDGDEGFWTDWLLDVHQAAGFPPMGYASASYFTANGLTNPGNDGDWDAFWTSTGALPNPPPGWAFVAMCQTSDSGTCALIGGGTATCDTDVFNGTVAQFLAYGAPGAVTPAPAPAPTPAPAPAPPAGTVAYAARPGDTYWAIAASHGLSLATLEAANPQKGPVGSPVFGQLQIGEIVNLPTSGFQPAAPPPATPSQTTYVVKPGDNLTVIAEREGISLSALEGANPWILQRSGSWSTIDIGWVLTIP